MTDTRAAAVQVTGLRKTFHVKGAPVTALTGIDLAVAPGEIFGLLGPNGAGKTTTLRILTTLLPADAGEALVAGADVRREPALVRRRIGYVGQLGGADVNATGRENLLLTGRLYGLGAADAGRRCAELLEVFGLGEGGLADRAVRTYSGGQRRRLEVALGITHRPGVLFLDEPRRPGTVAAVEIMTSAGPARVAVEKPAGRPRFLVMLTHGSGGTPDTPDVLAVRDAARGLGAVTALVTQPYVVRGGRAPGSVTRQDAAWAEIVAALSESRLPLVQGGRSNGARVACRTAREVGAVGVIALAFPLHPPGRPGRPGRPGQPGKSRDAELRAAGTRVLVLNGDRDPFGIPEQDDATVVVVLPGETHALSKNPAAIGEAVAGWLGTLPGLDSRPSSVGGRTPPR